jgi:DNA/RNA-binding domain of Phe-tRNA-synthetase-like protein
MTDAAQIIAIYPYRDSDTTKVTSGTKNIHIVSCGVPNVDTDKVVEAYELCALYLREYTHGIPSGPVVSPG